MTYVVPHRYTKWGNDKHTVISAVCELFDEMIQHNGYFVFAYGSVKDFDDNTMVMLDKTWTHQFQSLLPNDRLAIAKTRPSKAVKPTAHKAVTATVVNKQPPPFIAENVSTRQDVARPKKTPSSFHSSDLLLLNIQLFLNLLLLCFDLINSSYFTLICCFLYRVASWLH